MELTFKGIDKARNYWNNYRCRLQTISMLNACTTWQEAATGSMRRIRHVALKLYNKKSLIKLKQVLCR